MIIRSSPTGGNFFAAIKSFDANITILGKFVLTVKNSIDDTTNWGWDDLIPKSMMPTLRVHYEQRLVLKMRVRYGISIVSY